MTTKKGSWLERFSHQATQWTGSSTAVSVAFGCIIAWLALGPLFRFSDSWQLLINTATTIITFLMVFLIQRTQNKESLAIQIKLNELIAVIEGASNRLIDIEDLSEQEVHLLSQHYQKLAELTKQEVSLTESHSIEEAIERYQGKRKRTRQKTPQTAQNTSSS